MGALTSKSSMDRLQLQRQLQPHRLPPKVHMSATWVHATIRLALAQCPRQSVNPSVESRQAQHLAQPAREITCATQANAMRSPAMESWTGRHARAHAESHPRVLWYEEAPFSKSCTILDLAAVCHKSCYHQNLHVMNLINAELLHTFVHF